MRAAPCALLAASLSALALLAGAAAPTLAGDARPTAYVVRDAAAIDRPLTETAPDAADGAATAAVFCAGCHGAGAAPALSAAVAGRDAPALRLAIVNLAVARPEIEGHAFYDLPPFDPEAAAMPTTALTAQEVEDLVAHLLALAAGAREGDRR
ncbi:c-type cytochrome [Rubrimonas cliftonensis]|uniref:Cytochrome c n=1 Tax=Rubrimonas cliftonensis TaxID=89524 RepID=A0A1H3Z7H3_9RHOB|nr:c-type cytochrome [Rubrimonas cliftonensis]SEA19763.1 Cytochrome c [Rubrimonas cliftonensis]